MEINLLQKILVFYEYHCTCWQNYVSLLHIEFQSTYNKWDVIRFAQYHLHFYNTYKEDLEKLNVNEKIKTVVVYTKKGEESSVNSSINTGSLNFKMELVFVKSLPGDEFFNEIKNKIQTNPNVILSKQDEQKLLYNPFMTQKSSIRDRAVEIAMLFALLEDGRTRFRLVGTLAILMKKHLDEASLRKIWEVFKMGAVFEKFQREHDEQIVNLTLKAIDMLKEGKSVNEVVDETCFDEKTVRNIKEKNNI